MAHRSLAVLLLLAACSSSSEGAAADGSLPRADAAIALADAPPPRDAALSSSDAAPAPPDAAPGAPAIPAGHPRIYLNPTKKAALAALLAGGNAAATRFKGMVDGQLAGGDVYDYQAWFSALLYQLTGEGRYADDAVARVDGWVAAEEARIARDQVAEVAGDSYLYVGDHIGDLALTLDWCFDRVTPAQRARWLAYANQAVWNVWHHADARWGTGRFPWSGWSVDNPSNNYYYSFLRATLLFGLAAYHEHPDAPGWVRMFRETKIRDQLVPTFARDLAGGGSREGTGYGVAMAQLFRLYDQWEQSTGERIAELTPHARSSLAFMLHEILPTLDRVAPIGDHARDSTAALFDYHRDYAQLLMALFPADPLAARARFLFDASSVPRMGQGFMFHSDFLYGGAVATPRPLDDLTPIYRGDGTGVVFARSSWRRDATWLALQCGPYSESHAHQDQGSFLLYRNRWLAQDQNLESHSGIQQDVRMHNLVRFETDAGFVAQRESADAPSRLVALVAEPAYSYLAADLTPVYQGRTQVAAVSRELLFFAPDVVVVMDRARATSPAVRRVFQVNAPTRPAISGRVATITSGDETLAVHALAPAASALQLVDWAAVDDDMNGGFRLDAVDAAGDRSLFLHVLVVGDAVASVAAADEAARRGARVTWKDGRSALVRFDDAAIGATLELRAAGGAVVVSGALPQTVETLPLFVPQE